MSVQGVLCAEMSRNWRQKELTVSQVLVMPGMPRRSSGFRLYQLMMWSLTMCSVMQQSVVTDDCVDLFQL